MSIRSRFFDSEASDRIYTSDAWAEIFERLATEGYVKEVESGLAVSESDPAAMSVDVALGVAWLQGRFFEVHTSTETLTIADSDPTDDRIDRVVVRLSFANREITLEVLTGTPAASPTAPALTRDANTYEISLAQVLVGATVTSIVNADITDERDDAAVCGRSIPVVDVQLLDEKGVANGYAPLDGDGDVPAAHLDKAPSSAPTTVAKPSNETLASSTTLQDDDDLTFEIGANETWLVEYRLFYSSPTAADLKMDISGPSGVAGSYGIVALDTAATGTSGDVTVPSDNSLATDQVLGGAGFDVRLTAIVLATIRNGATAGSVTLRWAQNVSDADSTIVYKDASLVAHKVA